MTHPDTIKLLADDYRRRMNKVTDLSRQRYNWLAYAAKGKKYIEAEGAIAAELAEMLRTLDPDGNYPTPDAVFEPDEPELATGLRQLADLMAQHPELAPSVYKSIQHSCSDGTPEERIRRVEELADLVGVEPRWDRHHYAATVRLAGGLEFLIVTTNSYVAAHTSRVQHPDFVRPIPEPERFVQATPTEVAKAYTSSAAHHVDPEALRDVVVVGAEERAALLEEHAADVAAADELERQGREMDHAAEQTAGDPA
jgi:hypothetical protein